MSLINVYSTISTSKYDNANTSAKMMRSNFKFRIQKVLLKEGYVEVLET